MKEKLKELNVAFAALDKKFTEIKADGPSDMDSCMAMLDHLRYMVANVSSRIDYVSESHYNYAYEHNKGHLPPIKTASQMEKALKSCGMDQDYDVSRPNLYVNASVKKGLNITAEFSKKKE